MLVSVHMFEEKLSTECDNSNLAGECSAEEIATKTEIGKIVVLQSSSRHH